MSLTRGYFANAKSCRPGNAAKSTLPHYNGPKGEGGYTMSRSADTPEQLAVKVKTDLERRGKIVRHVGIRPE